VAGIIRVLKMACTLCKHVSHVSVEVSVYVAFHATRCSIATAAAHNLTLQAVSLPVTAQIYFTNCNVANLSNRFRHSLGVTQLVMSSCGLLQGQKSNHAWSSADAMGSIARHALQLHAFNESGQTLEQRRSQAVLRDSAISTK